MSLPIVDIAALQGDDPAEHRAVAAAIGEACRSVGFFYIVGHGVDRRMIGRVFSAAATFFGADEETKQSVALLSPETNRGYVGVGREALDPHEQPDLKEAFNIGLELEPGDPDLLAGKPFRHPNRWPSTPGFRDTMLAYYDALAAVGARLHRAVALDLALAPDYFAERFRKPISTLRLLHYPPSSAAPGAQRIGAGVHTDYGNLTILATDQVGGLMVRDRSGAWIAAPPVDGAFICNIGDCLMRWSNDVYVSTPHKVEAPPGLDRYSAAFFVEGDPEAVVACIPSCVRAGEEPKYPPVTVSDYIRSRLQPTYAEPADV